MTKKTSHFYFTTIVGLLIGSIPVISYGVISVSTPITVGCASTSEKAKLIQVYYPQPNHTHAILKTNGLLFKTNSWLTFSNGQSNTQYFDINNTPTTLAAVISESKDVGFTGATDTGDNEALKAPIYAWFPNSDELIDIQAFCIGSNIFPDETSDIPFISTSPKSEQNFFDEKLAELESSNIKISANMWPKNEITCYNPQGIAVKFNQPNSAKKVEILYVGTLTIYTKDEEKEKQPIKTEEKLNASTSETLSTYPSLWDDFKNIVIPLGWISSHGSS